MPVRLCEACGSSLRAAARFCPSCGAQTNEEVAERKERSSRRRHRDRRAVSAIATIFVGTVLSIVLVSRLLQVGVLDTLLGMEVTFSTLIVLTGLGAAALLGRGALGGTFAKSGKLVWCLAAVALGAAGFGFSHFYVEGIQSLYGFEAPVDGAEPFPLDLYTVISIAVLPALLEEWLTRGVLWKACERVTTPGRTILITAFLFTFMHGVGGDLLVYPHRFVGGLTAGWLRHRSGSLLPGIVEHFTHNLLCILRI